MTSHWWRSHVAWRLVGFNEARRRFMLFEAMRRRREAMAQGRCGTCHGEVDNPAFLTCTQCRRRRANAQRAAAQRRNAIGLCARCPGPLDRDGVLCSVCVSKQRKRTRDGRGKDDGLAPMERPDMAPTQMGDVGGHRAPRGEVF